jgi:RNA polymerase sigma-70 factor (ECF subfamily)
MQAAGTQLALATAEVPDYTDSAWWNAKNVDELRKHHFHVCVSIVKDVSKAEDVFQEALINAWLHVATFRRDSAFDTWFRRIMINASLQYRRRQRKVMEFSYGAAVAMTADGVQGVVDFWDIVAGDLFSPEVEFSLNEFMAAYEAALAKVDLKQYETLELYLDKHDLESMGVRLGLSPSCVKTRVFRARQFLKERLMRRGYTSSKDLVSS